MLVLSLHKIRQVFVCPGLDLRPSSLAKVGDNCRNCGNTHRVMKGMKREGDREERNVTQKSRYSSCTGIGLVKIYVAAAAAEALRKKGNET